MRKERDPGEEDEKKQRIQDALEDYYQSCGTFPINIDDAETQEKTSVEDPQI